MIRMRRLHSAGNVDATPSRPWCQFWERDPDSRGEGIVAWVNIEEAARLRREYEAEGLVEGDMASDPFSEFQTWLAGVAAADIEEPSAFVLATADTRGRPSSRAVLMKDFSAQGIVFYTGLASRKSEELRMNPVAAATFFWVPLHRQVRFEGQVVPVKSADADLYFAGRPRGAQVAAHASAQSSVVSSRAELEERYAEFDLAFGDGEIPRPATWGGWRLVPGVVEFWQGQVNRFHDRVRYRQDGDMWIKERLAP
jgi:pyridoxamine 5'-phosphate oxidase